MTRRTDDVDNEKLVLESTLARFERGMKWLLALSILTVAMIFLLAVKTSILAHNVAELQKEMGSLRGDVRLHCSNTLIAGLGIANVRGRWYGPPVPRPASILPAMNIPRVAPLSLTRVYRYGSPFDSGLS